MPRVALIVNPYSSDVSLPQVERVERALRTGTDVTRLQTEGPGHATVLAAHAADSFDALIVYGGDGTYNEAVNGAGGRIPFGFVPGGGASVFPRALGLSRDPATAAASIAAALTAGRTRAITLGRVNGRRFLFAAGVGFDGDAVRAIDRRGRRPDGRRASNLVFGITVARSIIGRGLRLDPQLEIEGHGRAACVFVANGRPYTYAGPIPFTIARDAKFEGGLDFVAPGSISPTVVPGLVTRMFRGTTANDPKVITGHDLDSFTIRCDRPLALQADGEDLGDVTEAIFTAERGALTVLV